MSENQPPGRRPLSELPTALSGLSSIGRRGVPRELLESRRRARILAASTVLFSARGYRQISSDDIATAANVSLGTFYDLFADKQGCLLAATERLLDDARARLTEEVPSPATWPERALAALLDLIEAEPAAARLLLVVLQTAGPEGAARQQAMLREIAAELHARRPSGPRAVELPRDFEPVAVAAAASMIACRLAERGAEGIGDLLPDLRRLLFRYVDHERLHRHGALATRPG